MESKEVFEMKKDDVTEKGKTDMTDDIANEKIAKDVINVINDIAPNEIKEDSDRLDEDLGMDSLGMIVLLTMIEDTFEIELDESDMNPFAMRTVQDVIDLVVKYFMQSEEKKDG